LIVQRCDRRREPELEPEWHKIRLITAEMIHFIRQMAAYCHLEVIDCSWKALMDFINEKEGDLDALISAHRVYLDRMVKKLLLIGPKAGKEVGRPSEILRLTLTSATFRRACSITLRKHSH
jgi:gamma-tubulin complex component 3